VRKAQAAHGISVIEVELQAEQWQMVRPSRYARRITANTPFALGGPAAGHVLMKTAADPAGRTVLGTIANCASGKTPWGTYLSGEENWANYFSAADTPTAHERRWGIRKATWYRWPEFDPRFDTVRNPNEPNRFGWVVEVDPMDPTSTPVKRTALGRAAHEGAWVAVTQDSVPSCIRVKTRVLSTSTSLSAATPSPRPPKARQPRRPMPNCWTTAPCTWRGLTPMAAACGCRCNTARAGSRRRTVLPTRVKC
jgi:hypothetical protein